jgi:hypothetical protein
MRQKETESNRLHSLRRSPRILSIALLVAAGCGVDPSEPGSPEPVDELAQAFTGTMNYSWGDTKYSFAEIGTATNRTCFLSGMTGNLGPFFAGGQTGVGVIVNAKGNYQLYVDATSGNPLQAFARCVSSAAGRTAEVTWSTGQAAQVLAPVAPGRQCFLTAITTSNQYGGNDPMSYGFKTSADYVRVWRDSARWYVGGVQSGMVWATARCMDVSQNLGNWEWIAGDPDTRKDKLALNPGGMTCLLTGIGGRFNLNDWSDGAFISYDAGINQFYMNTKNGKTGWSTCVK